MFKTHHDEVVLLRIVSLLLIHIIADCWLWWSLLLCREPRGEILAGTKSPAGLLSVKTGTLRPAAGSGCCLSTHVYLNTRNTCPLP